MGIDQAFLYPTWFAEGFHLVADPDTAYALARAYNDWIADFCQAAPQPTVRGGDAAVAGHGLYACGTAARCWPSAASAARSFGRCFSRTITSPAPISTRCGRSWSGSGWWRRCIRRPACGIRNGPRTGSSSRRSRTGLARLPLPAGGGGPFSGGGGGLHSTSVLHRVPPARASDGADPVRLAGQSHVRRLDADRLHRDAALSRR